MHLCCELRQLHTHTGEEANRQKMHLIIVNCKHAKTKKNITFYLFF